MVRAWGDNRFAALGNGTRVSSSTPVTVSGLRHVVSVAAGDQSAYALLTDGTVWAWWDDVYGRWEYSSGILPVRGAPDLPQRVTVTDRHVIAVVCPASSGPATPCSPMARSRAWGGNQFGYLGNGMHADSLTPVTVKGLTHVVAISARHAGTATPFVPTAVCGGEDTTARTSSAFRRHSGAERVEP